MDLGSLITLSTLGGFAAVWTGVGFAIGRFGSWGKLAQHYSFDGDFGGDLFKFRGAEMGGARYRGCLTVGLSGRGLYLSMTMAPILLPGHKPLLIPWSEILEIQRDKGRFGVNGVRLLIGRAHVNLFLYASEEEIVRLERYVKTPR